MIRWTKSGASAAHGGPSAVRARRGGRHRDLLQGVEGRVDGGVVLLHDHEAALAVGVLDAGLDGGDRLLARQDAAQREEARLHHGVDPVGHPRVLGDAVGVDDPEVESLGDDLLLDLEREPVPHLVGRVRAVEQERGPRSGRAEQVDRAVEERPLVTRHEVGAVDQVGGPDGVRAEPQVRGGHRPRLAGVVDEVALGPLVRVLTDDLDRRLVGADGAVGAEPPEDGLYGARGDRERGVEVERQAGDVIADAERELRAGGVGMQLVEGGLGHRRCELLRRQAVPAADHQRASRRDGPTTVARASTMVTSSQRGSAGAPGSFVRSSTATERTVDGRASRRASAGNGR